MLQRFCDEDSSFVIGDPTDIHEGFFAELAESGIQFVIRLNYRNTNSILLLCIKYGNVRDRNDTVGECQIDCHSGGVGKPRLSAIGYC